MKVNEGRKDHVSVFATEMVEDILLEMLEQIVWYLAKHWRHFEPCFRFINSWQKSVSAC